jgi:biotin transport system substrate-specific component
MKGQTIAEAIVPGEGILRDIALIGAGSAFVATLAQISIPLPFSPVPITGQTLAVLLVGAVLGSKRGAIALMAYLAEGIIGIPVFAGGTGGIGRLLGPTGGYLVGFIASSYLVGLLSERGWDKSYRGSVLAMVVGNAAIYLFGIPWLIATTGVSLKGAIFMGFLPFIPGDALKLLIASGAMPVAWRIIGSNPRWG